MSAQNMELRQWHTLAPMSDVADITGRVLSIWNRPAVQKVVSQCGLQGTLWTDYQNMGPTDLRLGFSTDSRDYPDITIYTEQSLDGFGGLPADADIVVSTLYEFAAGRRLFGQPVYRSRYVTTSISIENSELDRTPGAIPDPLQYKQLTKSQRLQIEKGRKQQSSALMLGHIAVLQGLLGRYDTNVIRLENER